MIAFLTNIYVTHVLIFVLRFFAEVLQITFSF